MKVQLAKMTHARSGDKGDRSDIGLFAYDEKGYRAILREVTAQRVKEHFQGLVAGHVERYELPNLLALKFVLNGALGGGASSSLRSDNLGKTMGSALLRMEIEVAEDEMR